MMIPSKAFGRVPVDVECAILLQSWIISFSNNRGLFPNRIHILIGKDHLKNISHIHATLADEVFRFSVGVELHLRPTANIPG
jgi:hypothetical protein